VARHIFQTCPVWIYTQSNITSILFTWVHYTNAANFLNAAGTATRGHFLGQPRESFCYILFRLDVPISLCEQMAWTRWNKLLSGVHDPKPDRMSPVLADTNWTF
jgi:hypothetical protein